MRTLLYGRVTLKSENCPECKAESFVVSGKLVCCGRSACSVPRGWKRIVDDKHPRRYIGWTEKEQIVKRQHGKCIYCDLSFSAKVYCRAKELRRIIHFDHFVPYSYSGNGPAGNIVAACSLCNNLKSWLMFKTLDECIEYIKKQWIAKRYTTEKPDIELSPLRDSV